MARSFKRHVGLDGVYNGDSEFMAGESIMFSGPADKIPAGYLIEDGAEVGRVAYATLFAAIGTTYGPGDGATTFNLPDSRGEFWRGLDLGRGVDAGRVLGSWQGDSLKDHSHPVGRTTTAGGGFPALVGVGEGAPMDRWTGAYGGSETRGRNLAKIPLIKY